MVYLLPLLLLCTHCHNARYARLAYRTALADAVLHGSGRGPTSARFVASLWRGCLLCMVRRVPLHFLRATHAQRCGCTPVLDITPVRTYLLRANLFSRCSFFASRTFTFCLHTRCSITAISRATAAEHFPRWFWLHFAPPGTRVTPFHTHAPRSFAASLHTLPLQVTAAHTRFAAGADLALWFYGSFPLRLLPSVVFYTTLLQRLTLRSGSRLTFAFSVTHHTRRFLLHLLLPVYLILVSGTTHDTASPVCYFFRASQPRARFAFAVPRTRLSRVLHFHHR